MAVWWNRKDVGLWIISLDPYSETFLQSGTIYPFGWSPDGKYVYAIRTGSDSSPREIVRVEIARPNEITSLANLPHDVVDYDAATVSPDGRTIIVSLGEEKSDVWLMENFDPLAARKPRQ